MSNRLEKFVKDNRKDFDKFEPGPVVWHNIQQQLAKEPPKKGVYISMRVLRWSAAAAIIITLGAGGFILMNKKATEQTVATAQPADSLPVTNSANENNSTESPTGSLPADRAVAPRQLLVENTGTPKTGKAVEKQNGENPASSDKELIAYEQSTRYFAKLIANKQTELKGLEKTNPALYKEFVNDINELDISYKSLRKQLPQLQDRSRLIKAMINNLQLQIELLNKQLIIVNQIESKQKVTNYERTT
jgi:hypothetical protein